MHSLRGSRLIRPVSNGVSSRYASEYTREPCEAISRRYCKDSNPVARRLSSTSTVIQQVNHLLRTQRETRTPSLEGVNFLRYQLRQPCMCRFFTVLRLHRIQCPPDLSAYTDSSPRSDLNARLQVRSLSVLSTSLQGVVTAKMWGAKR